MERLIAHAQEYWNELALVFIDVSKAFDSIAHESLLQALEYIGVTKQLRNYFQYAYEHSELKFKGNNHQVRQRSGIKQVDPTSWPKFSSAMNMAYTVLDFFVICN